MSRKQKDFDPKRNHIFAAAIDELRRREGKKLSQKEIADRMGVTEDTISRIMRLHNQVTEDIITRLQTASGCIFNLQWLRGESDVMLAADVDNRFTPAADNLHESTHIDQGSLMNATIAAQQTSIESLKREVAKTEESAKREWPPKTKPSVLSVVNWLPRMHSLKASSSRSPTSVLPSLNSRKKAPLATIRLPLELLMT